MPIAAPPASTASGFASMTSPARFNASRLLRELGSVLVIGLSSIGGARSAQLANSRTPRRFRGDASGGGVFRATRLPTARRRRPPPPADAAAPAPRRLRRAAGLRRAHLRANAGARAVP